jgi:hypothetical protein
MNRTWKILTCATLTAFGVLLLSGCASDGSDRMDVAMKKGAAAGMKASATKHDSQKRVNEATSILDGK